VLLSPPFTASSGPPVPPRWSWTTIPLSLCVCFGCDKSLSLNECDSLLDHYTASLLRNESPTVTARVIAEKQQAARDLAHRDPAFEFERCSASVSRQQYTCAMTASDVDSLERCLTL
jgi:hypothetical protein